MNLDGRIAIVTGGYQRRRGEAWNASAPDKARVSSSRDVQPRITSLAERITAIRGDHRVDTPVEAAFNLISRETSAID